MDNNKGLIRRAQQAAEKLAQVEQKQIPCGLKSARDDRNKVAYCGTTEVVP
jgi:hypothetical protein